MNIQDLTLHTKFVYGLRNKGPLVGRIGFYGFSNKEFRIWNSWDDLIQETHLRLFIVKISACTGDTCYNPWARGEGENDGLFVFENSSDFKFYEGEVRSLGILDETDTQESMDRIFKKGKLFFKIE